MTDLIALLADAVVERHCSLCRNWPRVWRVGR